MTYSGYNLASTTSPASVSVSIAGLVFMLEPGGIVAALQDIETAVAGLLHRGLMIAARGGDEIIDVHRFDAHMDQGHEHGSISARRGAGGRNSRCA